ncbi:protease modulator HflC [Desertibaculum subflavum]|uniref:protease modulator HflC n=1 Tax=Desertibaculum subflavum TaxID=2268458 RepID=UPI000E66B216
MNRQGPLIAIGVAVILALVVIFGSMFVVDQRQQALVVQLGDPIRVVQEPGLNFKVPLIQDVIYIDKRILALEGQTEEVIAADQKRLLVDSFVRFRIVDPLRFFQAVGSEQVARQRLSPLLNSALRQVLGNQDFQATLSGERARMMTEIRDILNREAKPLGLDVIDVRIKRADLPEANSQAVYRRMQTEREREAKENRAQGAEIGARITADADRQRTIILAEAQRQSEILRGDGEGQRAKIFAEAAGQDASFYAFYRSLQAYRQALQDGNTAMVLTPDSEFFKFFNNAGGGAPPTK